MHPYRKWTDDEIREIFRWREFDGLTYEAIARMLTKRKGRDITKNTIIGVYHRHRYSEIIRSGM